MTFALTPDIIIAAIISGAIIGVFLGTFGGGGSVLAAPLLLYVVGVSDPHVAIGTSAAAVAAIALFSLIGHWRGGNVKWPCAIVFALSGFAGSVIGSSIAKQVDGTQLLLAFSAAMAVIALSMFRKPAFAGNPDVHLTPVITLRLAPLGLIVGMAARPGSRHDDDKCDSFLARVGGAVRCGDIGQLCTVGPGRWPPCVAFAAGRGCWRTGRYRDFPPAEDTRADGPVGLCGHDPCRCRLCCVERMGRNGRLTLTRTAASRMHRLAKHVT